MNNMTKQPATAEGGRGIECPLLCTIRAVLCTTSAKSSQYGTEEQGNVGAL